MRTALQAAFGFGGTALGDETREKREKIERELRRDERSVRFFQRLRAATSRIDLNAPEVFAEESFPDANIVAEYLDCNDISPEIAAEYEKVCWESPEILAEIGCCFDFLTNALADASEPPVNCRRRLYYIAWEEATASASGKTDATKIRSWDACLPENSSNSAILTSSTHLAKKTAAQKSENAQDDAKSSRFEVDAICAERPNSAALPSRCALESSDVSSIKRAKREKSARAATRTARRAPNESRRREKRRDVRDNEIAKTLNAERKAKRSRRSALCACVFLGIAVFSYKTLTNNAALEGNVESTIAKTEEKLVFSNSGKKNVSELELQSDVENVVAGAPIPLRPSTISRGDAFDAEPLDSKNLAFFDENELSSDEAFVQKNAPLVESVVDEGFASASEPIRVVASTDAPKSGGGLNSSNLDKKPTFVIPKKNNDVFSKPLRF